MATSKRPAPKTTLKKSSKRTSKKTAKKGAKMPKPFTIGVKMHLAVAGIQPQEDRQTLYKAVCLFEPKDLTDWTNETTADRMAEEHQQKFLHPVTVLEMH
jgi:hypothetical protein